MGSTTGYRHITRTLGVFCALSITALFIFSAPVYSDNRYWIGGDGDWGVVDNWGGTLPQPGDTAWLDSSGQVAYTDNNPALRELNIEASNGNSMVLNHSGGTLTLAPAGEDASYLHINATGIDGNDNPSIAAYNLSGNGMLVKGAGEVKIGTSGSGYFNQSGGEFQLMGALYLGDQSGSYGEYNLTGGVITGVEVSTGVYDEGVELFETHYGGIALGEWGGTGVFNQSGDSYVRIDSLELARQANSTGRYTLEEGELTILSYEKIGLNGEGALTQNGGTHTVEGELTLGVEPAGYGMYSLHGGELTASAVIVGDYGTGAFTQDGGTHYIGMGVDNYVQDGEHMLIVARSEGSSGTYTLSGDGSLYVKGAIVADAGEYGLFDQYGDNSRHSVHEDLIIGNQEGSSGEYRLGYEMLVCSLQAGTDAGYGQEKTAASAGGPTLEVGGSVIIGNRGSGSFSQGSGTHTIYGDLVLGQESPGTGTYDLRDGGLEISGDSVIGRSGTGSFEQYGGTKEVGGDLYLGYESGSRGTYSMQGDSTLYVSGTLHVGEGGTAEFIQSGGTLNASAVTVNQYGTFTYSDGELNTDVFNNYGEFIGSGTINPYTGDGAVSFMNSGTLKPGNSPGTLTINGDYFQSSEGILEIELGGYDQGDSYDFLAINGTASLGGTLNLVLWDNFTPTDGQTFDILYAAGGLTGEFASINAPSGWIWDLAYLDLYENDTSLFAFDTVRITANAVPIPGTLLMLGTGLLGILGIRRRMRV